MFPDINKGERIDKIEIIQIIHENVMENHLSFRTLCEEGQIYIDNGKKEKLVF